MRVFSYFIMSIVLLNVIIIVLLNVIIIDYTLYLTVLIIVLNIFFTVTAMDYIRGMGSRGLVVNVLDSKFKGCEFKTHTQSTQLQMSTNIVWKIHVISET